MYYYNNFLKNDLDKFLLSELNSIENWKIFNRNNSFMKEYYQGGVFLDKLRLKLHSKNFINWIEGETSTNGLVVDSQGIGEGVSLMETNNKLNAHIDFNWNDRIKMHRCVNLLIYLGKCTGGEFIMWDKDMNKSNSYPIEHNTAIIFCHSETNAHEVRIIKSGKRYTIRQFYYKSTATCETAHQSLYWYNTHKKMKSNT